METKRDEQLAICQQAMQLLREQESYTQADVIGMMSQRGVSISPAAFSGLLKQDKTGEKQLRQVADALMELVYGEFGMEWVDGKFVKTAGADFIPKKAPTKNIGTGKKGHVKFEEERLKIEVEFFKEAQGLSLLTLKPATHCYIS